MGKTIIDVDLIKQYLDNYTVNAISYNGNNVENLTIAGEELWSASPLVYTLLDDGTYEVSAKDENISGSIEIPSEYKGVAVTSIGYRAFYDCTSLTSITIPVSITSIGKNAFYGCGMLNGIVLGNNAWTINNTVYVFSDGSDAATALTTTYNSYIWTKYTLSAPQIAASVTKYGGYDEISITISNPNPVALDYYVAYNFSGANQPSISNDTVTVAANNSTTFTTVPYNLDGSDTTFNTGTITVYTKVDESIKANIAVAGSEASTGGGQT